MLNKTELLGVNITTNSEEEILKYVVSELDKPRKMRKQLIIFTPNPEQLTAAHAQPQLKDLLNKADIALPDGVGIVKAAQMLRLSIKRRITGADFMDRLLKLTSSEPQRHAKEPVKSGFFGGQKGVAVEAANCLQNSYKNIVIGYASDTYNKKDLINSDVDILFVGLGFPKQEQWIIEHKDEIPTTIIMAVGGSFDFFSGKVGRAPKVVQDIGAEWLYRLIRQPWRAKRQARLLGFSALIFKSWVGNHLKR